VPASGEGGGGVGFAKPPILGLLHLPVAQIVCLMGIMYMAQTSNPYYSNPQAISAVTAIVLTVIITAIVYFVVVVAVEIFVLYNESGRTKAARRASVAARSAGGLGSDKQGGSKRRLTADGDAAAGAPAASTAGGGVIGAPDEPAIGAVSNEMNPMFLSTRRNTEAGDGDDKVVDSATEAIMAMRDAPNQTMWVVFQQTYTETQAQLRAAQEQLVASKVHAQKLEARLAEATSSIAVSLGGIGAAGDGSGGGGGGASLRRPTKTSFGPSRSTGDPATDGTVAVSVGGAGEDDRLRSLAAYRGGGGRTENPLNIARRTGSMRRHGT